MDLIWWADKIAFDKHLFIKGPHLNDLFSRERDALTCDRQQTLCAYLRLRKRQDGKKCIKANFILQLLKIHANSLLEVSLRAKLTMKAGNTFSNKCEAISANKVKHLCNPVGCFDYCLLDRVPPINICLHKAAYKKVESVLVLKLQQLHQVSHSNQTKKALFLFENPYSKG